jgi:integrase
MKDLQHARDAGVMAWQWPLDVTHYDRTAQLNHAGWQQLEYYCQHRKGISSFKACTSLRRLLRPIEDVIALTQPMKQTGSLIIRVLLQEMYRRRTSFWGWTQEEWVAFLGKTHEDFYQRLPLTTPRNLRHHLLIFGYLLCSWSDLHVFGSYGQRALAMKVFGADRMNRSIQQVRELLLSWGYSQARMKHRLPITLAEVCLANRSPCLEDLTLEVLERVRQRNPLPYLQRDFLVLSRALVSMGILPRPLSPMTKEDRSSGSSKDQGAEDVPQEWLEWCRHWREVSTLAAQTRQGNYRGLIKVGRWLAAHHPEVVNPKQWTRALAAEYVGAVDRMTVGQWVRDAGSIDPAKVGKPFAARTKSRLLASVRTFFRDCQEWEWIPRRFDPGRCFATPRSILALIGPDPRIIEDDIWAKLLWAGLNLTEQDLPLAGTAPGWAGNPSAYYPVELMRAMTLVWLFCGLRSDEWYRLRVGCIRWQQEGLVTSDYKEPPQGARCLLEVPTNKTGTSFTKPIDRVVGEAVEAWERMRPLQPLMQDPKTNELVHLLFCYRGYRVGKTYINEAIIPMLCRKSGVPEHDARGDITSHRARSTIATQLFNAKEPRSLFELQEWLGHRSPASTQYYAKISPTKLARSYEQAGYFGRNLRTIEVLIDQDAVRSGAAAAGDPWKFYDLGHGYCLYEFFDQCPHRMACARCSFYRPKGSTQAQLLEGKANLLRMLQEIPLSEEERAAVEDGVEAMEKLCQRLVDVPTPAGPTPGQLAIRHQEIPTIIPLEEVRRKR